MNTEVLVLSRQHSVLKLIKNKTQSMHRKLNYETKGIQYEIKVVHSMFYVLALWIVTGFFC